MLTFAYNSFSFNFGYIFFCLFVFVFVYLQVGAELAIWFAEANATRADELWRGAASALSGITCASLQFMDARVTTTPHWASAPTGVAGR